MEIQALTFIITGISSAIITLVVFILYNNLKQRRYDNVKNMAMLESMRDSIEKQIYDLNKKLAISEDRWRDVNHLLLRNEYIEQDSRIDIGKSRKIELTNFLKSNGITPNDVIVEKRLIFVLTPFHRKFEQDFYTIKEVCHSVGLKCIRGDEFYLQGDIFSEMLKFILKAEIIIANINGRNPNVLYELGIAQALDKPVILISKQPENLPIDIKSRRFLIYKSIPELEKMLKNELIKLFSK